MRGAAGSVLNEAAEGGDSSGGRARQESETGGRGRRSWFWIVYAPQNHASGTGLQRAGFEHVADVSFTDDGRPALRARRAELEPIIRRVFSLAAVVER